MKRNVSFSLAAPVALVLAILMAPGTPTLYIVRGDEIADTTKAAGKFVVDSKV